MDIAALDVNLGSSSVEVLILQLTDFAAIHGIGVFGAELLHVKLHHTATDFLIRRETDLDFTVLEVGMLHHVLGGIHDFGHTRFVVGAE